MAAMNELIAKIHAEIDKDIKIANGEDWHAQEERHWPDRIERQAAAFRKILDLHQDDQFTHPSSKVFHFCSTCGEANEYPVDWPCPTLLALADVYGIEHP